MNILYYNEKCTEKEIDNWVNRLFPKLSRDVKDAVTAIGYPFRLLTSLIFLTKIEKPALLTAGLRTWI
jgi:hypothetical protein